MEILVKWLGAGVVAFALAQAGRAMCLAVPGADRVPTIEFATLSVDSVGTGDLSAWVLETNAKPRNDSEPTAAAPSARARFSGSSAGSWGSVANRNANPLNIKLGSGTRRYVETGLATISEIIPNDGGRFLKFDSPATGFRVAVELLSTPPYHNLGLDRALRRWSNNGYGAEILEGSHIDAHEPVPYLGLDDLEILLNAMVAAEGYKSSTIADEIKSAVGTVSRASMRAAAR